MGRAKEIVMRVIPTKVATPFMKAHHYSGKVVNNSTLHFGVFLDGNLHGVMSYGPSLDKSKIIGLVKDTGWNEFLELNRMAFDSVLPRNSESRAISLSIRLLKKYAPHVKWIVSFADACSCGDGAIYRASNFVLQTTLLYGAVVLMVICLTVLSLQQLLDAGQYRARFQVLRRLGVEEIEIHRLVMRQLGVWFGLPVGAAVLVGTIVTGCFVGALEAEINAYVGFGALAVQLGVMAGILAILLGCYFVSTWALFRRAIEE